eukprot:897915-Amphidinium_carterae.1
MRSDLVKSDPVRTVSLGQPPPHVCQGTVRVCHDFQAYLCSFDDRLAVRPYLQMSLRMLHRIQDSLRQRTTPLPPPSGPASHLQGVAR